MQHKQYPSTLALYVTRRGVAFVFLVHPTMVINWGTKYAGKNDKHGDTLRIAKRLIEEHRPQMLVLEDASGSSSRRPLRVRRLNNMIGSFAKRKGIKMEAYSREQIQGAFSTVHASTKHEINCVTVRVLPALAVWQPPKRRCFDPESLAQGVFDAAALGLTVSIRAKFLDIAGYEMENDVSDLL